jgi:hypothetical protein
MGKETVISEEGIILQQGVRGQDLKNIFREVNHPPWG